MRPHLLWVVVAVVGTDCSHLAPPPGRHDELGSLYDGNEAQLRVQVVKWFQAQGVTLEPWDRDPRVLVSRVKETNVGITKGEIREIERVDGPQAAPGGEGTAPLSIDAEAERARTANLEPTSRLGAREFAVELSHAYNHSLPGDGSRYDKFGQDRSAYVDRDWWEVRFRAASPKQTYVLILRNHASDWSSSAEKSYVVGTSLWGHAQANTPPVGYFARDVPKEQALAEYLQFSAAVELVGTNAPADATGPLMMAAQPSVAPPAPNSCGFDLAMVELRAGELLLLTDPGGTVEALARFRQAVCAVLAKGLPVTVALSLSATEQARINAWLASNGTAADRLALLAGPFWRRPWQDGRSSSAMLALLEALRGLVRQGHALSVLAADAELRGNERTTFIAERLLQHRRAQPARVIVGLFSNTLISQRPGTEWDPKAAPLGYRLTSAGARVRSYDAAYVAGTQWTCRVFRAGSLRCGTWSAVPGPKQRLAEPKEGLDPFERPSAEGFDGLWWLGRLTASPPALGLEAFKDEGA